MKVKELRSLLEEIDGRNNVVIELFGKKVELEFEYFVVKGEKELSISLDDGYFISTPLGSDHAKLHMGQTFMTSPRHE